RHTSFSRDWSSDVCSSDLNAQGGDSVDGSGGFALSNAGSISNAFGGNALGRGDGGDAQAGSQTGYAYAYGGDSVQGNGGGAYARSEERRVGEGGTLG